MNLFKEVSVRGDAITARAYHSSVVFKNRLYVVMGNSSPRIGDVYWTDDCQVWHKQGVLSDTDGNVIPPRYFFGLCKHNQKVYILGGRDSDRKYNSVYETSDMIHWKRLQNAPWSARRGFVVLSFNGKLWVMGGEDTDSLNDVWWTRDCVNWTQEPNAAWVARRVHSGIVHNNMMYVIGGWNGSYLNDVWSTQNGRDWIQVSAAAEFTGRYHFPLTTIGDRIVLMGGKDGSARQSDLWHSVDGRVWKLASNTTSSGGLSGHSVNYFNNRLVVACGHDGSNYRNNVFIGTDKLFRIK